MRRRQLLALAGAYPFTAAAQSPKRVGFLITGDAEPTWSLFRKAMADLGYKDGGGLKYEFRNAESAGSKLDEMAADLVRLKVDVIVTVLTPAVAAARRATKTIPIAWMGADTEAGGITDLSRPGGNVTGVFSPSSTLAGKALQLFHEMKPQTKLFGLLLNSADPFHVPLQRDIETVATVEKIELLVELPKSRADIAPTMDGLIKRGVDGVMIQPSLGLDVAAADALARKLPAISFRREFAVAGGLLSYATDYADLTRVLAQQTDKLLKGVPPGNIPVQQPTRFEMVVNRKTAAAVGISLSPTFLARADEVIE
jgi:putative tryptophan/tyrosine transport system substrate-binding protein